MSLTSERFWSTLRPSASSMITSGIDVVCSTRAVQPEMDSSASSRVRPRSIAPTRSSTWSGLMTRGGVTRAWSPTSPSAPLWPGYTAAPSSMHARAKRNTMPSSTGNGSRVAQDAVAADQRLQARQQLRAARLGCLHQVVPLDVLEYSQTGCRGNRVLGIRVAHHPGCAGLAQRSHDPLVRHHYRQRSVATAHTFGRHQDVRHDIPVLDGEPATRPSEAGHDL